MPSVPRTIVVAVLDTSVLMRLRLLEFSLRIARAGGFHARWSPSIEDELQRKLAQRRPEIADRVLKILSTYPNARVTVAKADYERAAPAVRDSDDVHVLAAALAAPTSIELGVNRDGVFHLVTDNIKDFDVPMAADLGITVSEPDAFFVQLLRTHPEAFVRVVDREPPERFTRLLEMMRSDRMAGTAEAISMLFSELG